MELRPPVEPTTKTNSATVPDMVNQWLTTMELLGTMLPDDWSVKAHHPAFAFSIEAVYCDFITTECQHKEGNFKQFVTRSDTVPAGCNCPNSDGERPCEHIAQLVIWLEKQLNSNQSLIRFLANRRFAEGSPSLESYKFDQTETFRQKIRLIAAPIKMLAANRVSPALADPFDFISVGKSLPTRVIWNFKTTGNQLLVDPFLQTAKKRGGWNKGKKLALHELFQLKHQYSDIERKILEKVRFEKYAYNVAGFMKIETAEILELLEGCDRVCFDHVPVEVVRREPWMELKVPTPQTIGFRFLGGRDVITSDNGYCVWWDREAKMVYWSRLNSHQLHIVKQLGKISSVPLALRPELEALCREYQDALTFKFDFDQTLPTETESFQPVLMLMMDESCCLHFAKRVRLLRTGELKLPGDGPVQRWVNQGQVGAKLYLRDSAAEQQLWSRLDSQLQLPAGDRGTLTDLSDALGFFERMQKLPDTPEEVHGLDILWDDRSEEPMKLLGNITPQNLRVNVSKSRDWFQLQGECDFSGTKMELSTLLSCLKDVDASSIHGDYVKLGNHGWAKISADLRKRLVSLHHSLNEDRKKLVFDATSARQIADLASNQIHVSGVKEWTQCLKRIESANQIQPVLPANLRAELRDYQKEGFAWMRRLAEWGVGGVLADDMGLGKTLQTLAVLLDRSADGPALVIAPTSVGFNWVRETEKFAPDLKVSLYRETDRDDFLTTVGAGDLVVSSYGLVLRDAEKLAQVKWHTLVLDEAQAIKNARSKTALAIQSIPADWTVALTGTPIENHLGELWSLFHNVSPGVFGGWEQFRKRYALAIERENCPDASQRLRERIRPFVLRRTKREVLTDLPPRTETNLYVELSSAERERYNRVRLSAIGDIDEIAKLDDVKDQRFRILALLTRLRQLACSPRLIDEEWKDRSSKLELLVETLKELRQEGHKCLVFSQFVKHLDLIREALIEEEISFEYLDGSTPAAERQNRVDQFQAGASDVFLISLKAGGTGLNLTAADYVIHMDPWWNPAVEDQATDRAHRIGQHKPVMVYRLISSNTIEDEILKLHDSKRDLVAGVLDGSQAAAKLSTADLVQMIRG